MLQNVAEDHILPVSAIGDQAQVGQRPLRRTHLLLPSGQQVTEVNHEVAVTLTHVLRKHHDAGEVVILCRLFFLYKGRNKRFLFLCQMFPNTTSSGEDALSFKDGRTCGLECRRYLMIHLIFYKE